MVRLPSPRSLGPRLALPSLLLASLATLPAAAACTWAMPAPLEEMAWPGEATGPMGTVGFSWGRVEEGRLVESHPRESHVSPDGRWAVFLRTGPKAPEGDLVSVNTCGTDLPRYVVVHDLHKDRFRLLDARPVQALAATPDEVHVLTDGAMRAYAWGAWDAPRLVDVPPELAARAYPRQVTAGPGDAYAWTTDGGLARFALGARDLGAHAADEGEHVGAIALSPDARHAALAVGAHERGWSLVVVELREGLPVLAREDLAQAGPAPSLAWGRGGIAAAHGRAPPDEATPPEAALRVYGEPLTLSAARERAWTGRHAGGLAWSPDGMRLALGQSEGMAPRLVLLDARTLAVERDEALEVERVDWPAWQQRLDAEAPAPQPRGSGREGWGGREVPAPQMVAPSP